MTDLKGKVILVTGAASGIGEATAQMLVASGCKVVGCDLNENQLQKVAERLNVDGPGEMFALKCDVTKEKDVKNTFDFVEKKFKTLHASVSIAGIFKHESILTGKFEVWNQMLQVNVVGVAVCAREAVQLMRKCGVDDGHVVNISSIASKIILPEAGTHFYSASKSAVSTLSEGLRQELRLQKSRIRVTEILPGVVNTAIFDDLPTEFSDKLLKPFTPLEAQDIAQSIHYALSAPLRVDVSSIIVRQNECPM